MRTTTLTVGTKEIRIQALPATEALTFLGDAEDFLREVSAAKDGKRLPRVTKAQVDMIRALAAKAQVKIQVEEKDGARPIWQPLELDRDLPSVPDLVNFGVQGVLHTLGDFQSQG